MSIQSLETLRRIYTIDKATYEEMKKDKKAGLIDSKTLRSYKAALDYSKKQYEKVKKLRRAKA
jgi:DNA-binding transcriptional regulator YiaG